MRIVIVINSFGRGGAEKSTASFMLFLKNKFKDIEIMGIYFDKHTHGEYYILENNGIPLFHVTEKGFFKKVLAVKKLLKNLKPDIVHSVLFEANIVVRFVRLFMKFYLIESLVNTSYSSNREFRNSKLKFKNNVIKWIDSNTSFLVNHFHAVSKAVADHYESVYGKKINATIIRRGRKLALCNKTNYTLGNRLNLFTIARQEYQKGLIYLFEAINLSKHDICLKIAGREGEASKDLRDYIETHKLEDKIQFVGFRDDLKDFFIEADFYISGSFFEGSPGSVIEAMSYGLPLILSDINEHRELVLEGENTIFFQLKNVNEILNIFDRIFNNYYNLESLGSKSFEIFSNSYVEEVIYSSYNVMYKNCLHGINN